MKDLIKQVRLRPGRYSLMKVGSVLGDSGLSWMVYDYDATLKKGDYVWLEDAVGLIRVGCGIRVGSVTARSYSFQDWWQCSPVTEILEVNEELTKVKFKTKNSIYVAESFK